jgi:hypothetical protein
MSKILFSIPQDVYKILITEQAAEKKRRNRGQFSLELTAYLIIRKWAKGILPHEFKDQTNGE